VCASKAANTGCCVEFPINSYRIQPTNYEPTSHRQGSPQQMSDGTLRTPGAVDFFRILNENVRVVHVLGGSQLGWHDL
jgi:hypothetical protein